VRSACALRCDHAYGPAPVHRRRAARVRRVDSRHHGDAAPTTRRTTHTPPDAESSLPSTLAREVRMIHVVAVITAHPGQRAKVLEAFLDNTAAVRAEEGCIEYGATIDAKGMPASPGSIGDDSFIVVEKWASLAALQAHAAAPHMKAYAAKVKDLIAKRVIHVLEPV
jgi:quinol monooxygenase YgiN